MGQRFGRNQRRRAREALHSVASQLQSVRERLSQVQHQHQSLARASSELSDVNQRNEVLLAQARLLLGKHSIAFDPRPLAVPRVERDGSFRVNTSDGRMATMHTVDIRAEPDWLKGMLHVTAMVGDQRAGYAISEGAMFHGPNELLAKHIGKLIAERLVVDLKRWSRR